MKIGQLREPLNGFPKFRLWARNGQKVFFGQTFCSTSLPLAMALIDIIKPLYTFLISAINQSQPLPEFLGAPRIKPVDVLGAKRECFPMC